MNQELLKKLIKEKYVGNYFLIGRDLFERKNGYIVYKGEIVKDRYYKVESVKKVINIGGHNELVNPEMVVSEVLKSKLEKKLAELKSLT